MTKTFLLLCSTFFTVLMLIVCTETSTRNIAIDTKSNIPENKGDNNMQSENQEKDRFEFATLAAGCFWGVQQIIDDIPGVIETVVGYTGGTVENPNYSDVKTGLSGHAEAVQIKFDPKIVSYEKLLDFFWRFHDPTQLNKQGPDLGTQYRSAIFYHSDQQRITAEKSKVLFDEANSFDKSSVTQILPAAKFYSAEDYHQKYFIKNGGTGCNFLRPQK